MRVNETTINEYFEWLYGLVCDNKYPKSISYRKLLSRLHSIEFRYSVPKDGNRADDGVRLRYRFANITQIHEDLIETIVDELEGPCSVLEMMVALAIRCETDIMDDPKFGDRTKQWFWGMIVNLGLGSMSDTKFDRTEVDMIINRFLDRRYEPDGRGGLFRVRDCDRDLRTVEIWYQLCWYLDSII